MTINSIITRSGILFFLLLSSYANSQSVFGKRNKKIVVEASYSYFKYDGDSVRCRRTSSAELRRLEPIDREQMNNDGMTPYGLFRPQIIQMESLLDERKSGVSGYEIAFQQTIEALNYLTTKYKIDLPISDYKNEFEFYQKHPVKSQEKLKQEAWDKARREDEIKHQKEVARITEYNNKIIRLRDSAEVANKKQQALKDSIDEANYRKEIRKQKAQDKINQQLLAEHRKKDQQENEQKEIQRRKNLFEKYGAGDGELIFNKRVVIGWTKDMCLESWGKPHQINKTTTATLTHEQWVYSLKKYLYFDNGILTAIQD